MRVVNEGAGRVDALPEPDLRHPLGLPFPWWARLVLQPGVGLAAWARWEEEDRLAFLWPLHKPRGRRAQLGESGLPSLRHVVQVDKNCREASAATPPEAFAVAVRPIWRIEMRLIKLSIQVARDLRILMMRRRMAGKLGAAR